MIARRGQSTYELRKVSDEMFLITRTNPNDIRETTIYVPRELIDAYAAQAMVKVVARLVSDVLCVPLEHMSEEK